MLSWCWIYSESQRLWLSDEMPLTSSRSNIQDMETTGCPPVCSQLKWLWFFGHIACAYWVTGVTSTILSSYLRSPHGRSCTTRLGVDAGVLHAHTNGQTVQKHNASGPMYWLSGEIKMQSTVTECWPNNVTRAAAWWRMVNSCCLWRLLIWSRTHRRLT